MRRFLLGLVALLLVAAGALAWILGRGASAYPVPAPQTDVAALPSGERTVWIERGRYFARISNCEACHASSDGLAYAGGVALDSPFGTFYGTNITPSRDHGIGGWSPDDLFRSLRWGIMPDGTRLYPSMPYTSYHYMTREDSDAIWAYLMSLPAIEKPDREHEVGFPFNIRAGIELWNVLYRPSSPMRADPERDEAWNRGRYLVDAAAHCGECHTPRNALYAMQTEQYLQGEHIDKALAPDITPAGLTRRGWTPDDLAQYLRTGLSPQGAPNFRMASVVTHATRYLTDADLRGIVAYLTANMAPPRERAIAQDSTAGSAGRDIYLGLCAGCHEAAGQGRPFASLPLATNTSIRLRDPLNLVRVIVEGVPPRDLPGLNRMQGMPAFGHLLDDRELVELTNYLRVTWGADAEKVGMDQIARARKTARSTGME
jgi:mono/diheme cytochrome c family protein